MTAPAPVVVGALSDSHGRVEVTADAARRLVAAGASVLLHCGDLADGTAGGFEVLAELARAAAAVPRAVEVRVVFGNCDRDEPALRRAAEDLGIRVDHPAGELEVAGRRLVFTHGHLAGLVEDAIARGADYVVHGHSHRIRDEVVRGSRVLNPGALFRASRYTCLRLEPASGDAEWITLPRRNPGSAGDDGNGNGLHRP